MKINKLRINSYGKLKEKEINLESGINLIYGQNEAGKSTLIKFIINSFYGISKNKKGKEISDFEKYKPWSGEEFSGKLEYELDNNEKYEIYRDFNKKNPKIFNENMEDISKQFNIDKNKGNEFFYEQTKIDEDLFLSTLAINQSEVKLEGQAQNFLIQKIANLAQTGDDSISFKRVIDRINRRQLDEVGTERSREKPINVVARNLQELCQEKENLEKYKNFKYEFEEKESTLNNEIFNLENEKNFLSEIKLQKENEKIENEKIKLKENLQKENLEKINLLNKEINELKINNKNILDRYSENNSENKNEKINELNYLEKEIENKIKKELIIINLNTDNYNQIIYNEEIEEKINLINKEINEKELEEHKLELDKQNIFPKIDRLANIQEELEYSLEEYNELKNNSEIIDIAKEYLEKAYKNMKENVTPKFSKELSQTISNISDGKYKNMKITDNDIMVEVENGNYVSASQLSEGTIEQLYFSLRMAILKEISNETLPIFLDESFVFFDKNRLINTINYLNSNHDNQIIIFSCTEREKDILDYLNIKYNLITL